MTTVRLAARDDAPLVADLLAEFRDCWTRDVPDDEALRRGAWRLLTDPDADILVAGGDGLAVVRYRFTIWVDGEECELEDLFVREAARERRIGRSLTEAAIERARTRGCRRMQINANRANGPAIALYESLGFSAWFDPPGGDNLNLRRAL